MKFVAERGFVVCVVEACELARLRHADSELRIQVSLPDPLAAELIAAAREAARQDAILSGSAEK